MLSQFRKVLRNTALGALVVLGANGAAHATLVVGVFDPAFGVSLPGVNFSGTASFSIAQDCLNLNLPASGLFVYSSNHCGSALSGMSFLGAHVDFTGSHTGSVDFLANSLTILGMYVQDHHVIGVQTTLGGPATSTLLGGLKFDLIFGMLNPHIDLNEGLVPSANDGDNDMDDFPASTFQVTSLYLVSGAGCSQGHPCVSSPAQTHFTPEPGSLALVMAALGAGWLVRRKSRDTSATRAT
jgi:hypothetical protein